MEAEHYAIVIVVSVCVLYWVISYIVSYPERKRFREQKREIEEILNGFDVRRESVKTLSMLRDGLPESYRCGRKGCDGILLKRGFYYVCTRCHNDRTTIRKARTAQ